MNARTTTHDRAREILEAAYRAFARDGYHHTTMDKIAQRIGVTKGTLYLYYKSKADLFVAVLEDRLQNLQQRIRYAIETSEDPKAAVERITQELSTYFHKERNFHSVFVHSYTPLPPEVRKKIARRILPILDQIELTITSVMDQGVKAGLFRGHIPPRLMALAFVWMVRGMMRYQAKSSVLARAFAEIFLYGVLREEVRGNEPHP